jgi:purine-binding chemotaxis protein CheW
MARPDAEANRPEVAVHHHDQNQYLTFMLGREMLAMGILSVKEILEYDEPTIMPMMPAHIRGVIDLRGSVVPVVDLAARIGKPSTPPSKKTCIVIIETGDRDHRQVVGAVVDAVNAVIEISAEDIELPPMFGSSIRKDFIEGLGKVNGKFVVVLDTSRVLSMDDLGVATPAAAH